ncbi:MAG TPA: Sua5/YciO/YrdC/YwlC family protein, partial [Acidimicrobiales bacterium]|nr:Sua5/YciO/YrdC/YwlC family protein [Acidimicrobiales bacterium]
MTLSDFLRAGEVVGIPTDTVYGLAVDPSVSGAVDRLFALKVRPRSTPIAVLVAKPEDASALGEVNAEAQALIERFWPGPLTLVLP